MSEYTSEAYLSILCNHGLFSFMKMAKEDGKDNRLLSHTGHPDQWHASLSTLTFEIINITCTVYTILLSFINFELLSFYQNKSN